MISLWQHSGIVGTCGDASDHSVTVSSQQGESSCTHRFTHKLFNRVISFDISALNSTVAAGASSRFGLYFGSNKQSRRQNSVVEWKNGRYRVFGGGLR
jgi:hypothetical protein